MTTIALSNQLKGTLYCVFGVLTVTPDALLVRKVSDLPNFDVIFWKSLFFALMLLVCLLASQGIKGTIKVFKDVGWIGWVAGVVWGISTFAFNYAFQHTAAANVLVITAANPMFSAVGSYFLLKEHIPWRTIAAAVVCFVSIIIIFYGQLGSGDGDAMGLLNAVIASLTMGIYFVLIRYAGMQMGAEPDMMPCNIIAGFVVIIVVAPMCDFVGLTLYHLTILMINGMLVLPISFTFLTIGPSLISAPEVSLYTLIETVLGPIWVWLGGYEAPPLSAVFGGTLLISALAIHSFVALREEKSPRRLSETANLMTKDLEQDDVPL